MTVLTIPQTHFSSSSPSHSAPSFAPTSGTAVTLGAPAAGSRSSIHQRSTLLKPRLTTPLSFGLAHLMSSTTASSSATSSDGSMGGTTTPAYMSHTAAAIGAVPDRKFPGWLTRARSHTDTTATARAFGGQQQAASKFRPIVTTGFRPLDRTGEGGVGESPQLPPSMFAQLSPATGSSYPSILGSGRSGHRRGWGSTDTAATSVWNSSDDCDLASSKLDPSSPIRKVATPLSPTMASDKNGNPPYPGSFVASLGLAPISYRQPSHPRQRSTVISSSSLFDEQSTLIAPSFGLGISGIGAAANKMVQSKNNLKSTPSISPTSIISSSASPSPLSSVPFPSPKGVGPPEPPHTVGHGVHRRSQSLNTRPVHSAMSLPDLRVTSGTPPLSARRSRQQGSGDHFLAFDVKRGFMACIAAPRPKLVIRRSSAKGEERHHAEDDDDSEVMHIRSIVPVEEFELMSPPPMTGATGTTTATDRPKKRLSAERVLKENITSQAERQGWAQSIPRSNSIGVRPRGMSVGEQPRVGGNEGGKRSVKRRVTALSSSCYTSPALGSARLSPEGFTSVSQFTRSTPILLRKRTRSSLRKKRNSYLSAQRPAPLPPSAPTRRDLGSSDSQSEESDFGNEAGEDDYIGSTPHQRQPLTHRRLDDSPPGVPRSFDGMFQFASVGNHERRSHGLARSGSAGGVTSSSSAMGGSKGARFAAWLGVDVSGASPDASLTGEERDYFRPRQGKSSGTLRQPMKSTSRRRSASVPEMGKVSERASEAVRGQDQALMDQFRTSYGLPTQSSTLNVTAPITPQSPIVTNSADAVEFGTAHTLRSPSSSGDLTSPTQSQFYRQQQSSRAVGAGRAAVSSKEKQWISTPPSKHHRVFSNPESLTQSPFPTPLSLPSLTSSSSAPSLGEDRTHRRTVSQYSLPRPTPVATVGALRPPPRKRMSPISFNGSIVGNPATESVGGSSPRSIGSHVALAFASLATSSSVSNSIIGSSSDSEGQGSGIDPAFQSMGGDFGGLMEPRIRKQSSARTLTAATASTTGPMQSPTLGSSPLGSEYFQSPSTGITSTVPSQPSSASTPFYHDPTPSSPLSTIASSMRSRHADEDVFKNKTSPTSHDVTQFMARPSSDSSHSSIDLDKFIDPDSLFYRAPATPRPDLIQTYSENFMMSQPRDICDESASISLLSIRGRSISSGAGSGGGGIGEKARPRASRMSPDLRKGLSRSELVDEILSGYMRTSMTEDRLSQVSYKSDVEEEEGYEEDGGVVVLGGRNETVSSGRSDYDDRSFNRLSMPASVTDGRPSVENSRAATVVDGEDVTVVPVTYVLREGPKAGSGSVISDPTSRRSYVSRISRVPSIIDAFEARLVHRGDDMYSVVADSYRNASLEVDANSPSYIDFRKSSASATTTSNGCSESSPSSHRRQRVASGASANNGLHTKRSFLDLSPADTNGNERESFIQMTPPASPRGTISSSNHSIALAQTSTSMPPPIPNFVLDESYHNVHDSKSPSPHAQRHQQQQQRNRLSGSSSSPRSIMSPNLPVDKLLSAAVHGRQSWRSVGSNTSNLSLASQLQRFPNPPQPISTLEDGSVRQGGDGDYTGGVAMSPASSGSERQESPTSPDSRQHSPGEYRSSGSLGPATSSSTGVFRSSGLAMTSAGEEDEDDQREMSARLDHFPRPPSEVSRH